MPTTIDTTVDPTAEEVVAEQAAVSKKKAKKAKVKAKKKAKKAEKKSKNALKDWHKSMKKSLKHATKSTKKAGKKGKSKTVKASKTTGHKIANGGRRTKRGIVSLARSIGRGAKKTAKVTLKAVRTVLCAPFYVVGWAVGGVAWVASVLASLFWVVALSLAVIGVLLNPFAKVDDETPKKDKVIAVKVDDSAKVTTGDEVTMVKTETDVDSELYNFVGSKARGKQLESEYRMNLSAANIPAAGEFFGRYQAFLAMQSKTPLPQAWSLTSKTVNTHGNPLRHADVKKGWDAEVALAA